MVSYAMNTNPSLQSHISLPYLNIYKECLSVSNTFLSIIKDNLILARTGTKNVVDFLVSPKKLAGQTQKLYVFSKHFPFVWQEKHGRGNPPCLCAGDGLQCLGEIRVSQW